MDSKRRHHLEESPESKDPSSKKKNKERAKGGPYKTLCAELRQWLIRREGNWIGEGVPVGGSQKNVIRGKFGPSQGRALASRLAAAATSGA